MFSNTLNLLNIGALTVFIIAVLLLLLVERELGIDGKLGNKGKWLLSASLGSGVLAFAFKLSLLLLMVNMPEQAIAFYKPASPTDTEISRPKPNINTSTPQVFSKNYVWESLPNNAPTPKDNPSSPEKIALGKRLFFDKNLSLNREIACASCHDIDTGAGVDSLAVSRGIHQQQGTRNAPTVWNAAFQAVLFWDGRAASLEEQAKAPFINPIEMGMPSYHAVEQRVFADKDYRQAFKQVFATDEIKITHIAAAIASYERSLIANDTPYDRFVRGDSKALNAAQLRGMALFESIGCVLCHSGANFSAAALDNGGAFYRIFPARSTFEIERYKLNQDTGRAPATDKQGVWRVPSLRNVALTAPYFHNGAVNDLEEAVRIMASVQLAIPTGRHGDLGQSQSIWSTSTQTLQYIESRPLSEQAVMDIVAFLHALSSDRLKKRYAHKPTPQEMNDEHKNPLF